MLFKFNRPNKPNNHEYYNNDESKSYDYYNNDEPRKLSRVLLTMSVDLTIYVINQEPLLFRCESKNISDKGMYLIFKPERELPPLNDLPVKLHLPIQKQTGKKYELKGRIAWSKPIIHSKENSLYIFCGIEFEEKLPFSIQLEQIAISTFNTWEKLLSIYKQNLLEEQNDPLKQLSAIWPTIKNDIPDFASIDCVFWYYFAPKDAFIKNSMFMKKNQHLYQIYDDSIKKQLMENHFPILESGVVQQVFSPISEEGLFSDDDNENSLPEWLFPLFDGNEFLGLVQFQFKDKIDLLLRVDWIFLLCTQIGNYVSSVIKSEELKCDNDYKEIFSQIMELSEPKDKKGALDAFYETILSKFTELMGEVPSFLQLFSEKLFIDEHSEFVPAFTICAIKNCTTKGNIAEKRILGDTGENCCPSSLKEVYKPDFCSVNCSPKKSSLMYCVPLIKTHNNTGAKQNELIALACFAVSKEFKPTQRLKHRINEVSESLSQLLQNGIQSYMEAQERSLLEKQGTLLTEYESGSQGLLVDLLKEIRDIMSAQVCILFWMNKIENKLYVLGTSKFDYYKIGIDGKKYPRIDFHEEFESFAHSTFDLDLDKKNLTPRVANSKIPVSVDMRKKWHKDADVRDKTYDTQEEDDGPFLEVPVFRLDSKGEKDVVGVLRCTRKHSPFKVFNRYDAEILTKIGRAMTPFIISIIDSTQRSMRVVFGAHEIRNFANLFISDRNKELLKYTSRDISDIAQLILIQTDDMQYSDKVQLTWEPDVDKTYEPRLYTNIIAPAVGLINFFLKTKRPEYGNLIVANQNIWQYYNPLLRVDRMRVIQIIFNLLNNACKHSDVDNHNYYAKRRYRRYKKDKVYVIPSKRDAQNVLTVDIINNGYEIMDSEKGKIFRFGYKGTIAKTKTLGKGIGLSICKQIIDAACKEHGCDAIRLTLSSSYDPVVFSLAFDLNIIGRW